jgi:hypothetical protein
VIAEMPLMDQRFWVRRPNYKTYTHEDVEFGSCTVLSVRGIHRATVAFCAIGLMGGLALASSDLVNQNGFEYWETRH